MENNKLLHWKVAGEILPLISSIFIVFPTLKRNADRSTLVGFSKKFNKVLKQKPFGEFFPENKMENR